MNPKLQTMYGLKFHPFRPDVPIAALHVTPKVDSFIRRVEVSVADGGFVMITGDPGTGKSVAMRLLNERLSRLPDVVVGTVEHPQSRTSDFYRELGDVFQVPFGMYNRWAGFKALRQRWGDHIQTTMMRPVLIIDEAQETLTTVLNELRILASKELDSKQLLCVVFAGDQRLPDRLRAPELLPLGSRIRRRLTLDYAARDELLACMDHLLDAAGNSSLLTTELKSTLADHAAGNYRVLMNMADELLAAAIERELPKLDEKLYLDVFAQAPRPKAAAAKEAVNDARLRELWAAPELALLPPLLAGLDALAITLRAQHPTLDHEWTAVDPASLLEARALIAVIASTRRRLVAYRRAVGRALRDPYCDGDDLPF